MLRILLIDKNDPRRRTRVMLLEGEGYEVVTANRFQDIEGTLTESSFDLVILEVEDIEKASIAYGKRLKAAVPKLPILVLSSNGLYLPKESVLNSFHGAHPTPPEVMAKIAALLMRSTQER